MTGTQDSWPAGATWVFQGTVAEDATGGTHVCTLTVTPGAGNEMQVLYGRVVVGNTATAQISSFFIDDGTNILHNISTAGTSGTTALAVLNFPTPQVFAAGGNAGGQTTPSGLIVSGTMRLVLQVSTAALSVTQTFAVVCRIKGAMPTAVLADTVGAPVLTTNTNKVF